MKSWFEAVVVVVAGALLGSFLGRFTAEFFPHGRLHSLFSTEITAGLHPAELDLRVVDLTLGCVFRFNVLSVVGILLAAFLYKRLVR